MLTRKAQGQLRGEVAKLRWVLKPLPDRLEAVDDQELRQVQLDQAFHLRQHAGPAVAIVRAERLRLAGPNLVPRRPLI